MKNLLITGGAGFVGSNLALKFKQKYPDLGIYCLDNLKRRGSELNIPRLKNAGIVFIHGDIRNKEDLNLTDIDTVIECSAEPSVLAGVGGSPEYVLNTNLIGTLNCLEFARRSNAKFIFISTSRVYPYDLLNNAKIEEAATRFEFSDKQDLVGISKKGSSEELSLSGPRTLYGSTKLASELFITEYIATYGLTAVINRFGCIAGPWQMGKVDQGVMALWVSRHVYKKNLKYIGFGGAGKQVRDFIHIDDVFDVLDLQISQLKDSSSKINGEIFNIGGGYENSISLQELTKICQEITGNTVEITSDSVDRPADLKIYISDNTKVQKILNWKPKKTVRNIAEDTAKWIEDNKDLLVNILE